MTSANTIRSSRCFCSGSVAWTAHLSVLVALTLCAQHWNVPTKVGKSVIVGVAGAGEEVSTRPFQLVTGRHWMGTAFGGVKGRSELPGMVDEYMSVDIMIDEIVTHNMGLEDINEAFSLMKAGKSIRSIIHY